MRVVSINGKTRKFCLPREDPSKIATLTQTCFSVDLDSYFEN